MLELRRQVVLLPVIAVPLLLTGFLIKYVASVLSEKRKYKNIPGSEVDGIIGFFVGNVFKFVEAEANDISVPEVFAQELMKHKSKTIKFRIFNQTPVISTDPRIVKEVLIDQNCYKHDETYKILGFPGGMRMMGNGLVTEVNHEKWRHQRSLFNPGFQKKVLMQFMKEFNDKSDILMEHLKTRAESHPNEPIRLLEEFNRAALDVIASVAFSMNVDSVTDPNNQFNKYIYEALNGIKHFFNEPLIKYNPARWRFLRRYDHVLKYLREIGERQIEERLEAIANGEPLPDDILTTILTEHEDGQEFSIEQMADEFVTFFIAGQETTANTLASALLELGRTPDALEKLKKEVDTVLGSKSEIEYDDLHKLKYTGFVFKEALRLYPAVPNIGRTTRVDIYFDDIFIPKGTWITVSSYCCARDPEFFTDPLKYNPDRFLDPDSIKNYTYFPFSMGPRNCIGQNFAQIEAKVLIAKFIQNFDFKLDPKQSMAMYMATTLRPKDGTKCFIKLRK